MALQIRSFDRQYIQQAGDVKHVFDGAVDVVQLHISLPVLHSGWNPYATQEQARETVQRFIDSYVDPRFYGWAIECEGRMIGTIGAYDFDPEKNQIEVGFSIERVSWGKGYAAEALWAVLEYLTIQEGIAHVTAWCASDNVASSRTLEKAGMRFSRVDVGGLEVGVSGTTDWIISIAIRKVNENMETKYYIAARIDGDYAWLNRTDVEEAPLFIARALLQEAIGEGTKLKYEMLQYEINGF